MGGVCGKSTMASSPGAAPQPPTNPAAVPGRSAVSTTTAKVQSQASRRESERRGLRQGLVHERKHTSVWDHYEIVKEIGHGMTGKVYQVQHKLTHEKYALKCMEMRRIDPELLDDLRNEIELLKMMDHPNVIKLYEYYEDEHNIYLILEFCDGGELFDRLHMQKGNRYSEAEAARLMFKMCAAIGYCHYMGISHRDLKLENFIFESKDPDSNIKLIDFGLSTKYGSNLRRMHTMVGTPYYIAPEVLNQSEGGTRGYTNACDCWSLGVIAYMLLSGTPPFKGRRDREVLQAVRRGKYTLSGPKFDHISEEAKDFIRHLLVYNPAKRMTAEQALKHPWLQRAKNEANSQPLDPEILTALRDFSKLSTFKRTALEAIAFSMSAQSISHLREQFQKLDKDQTGFVTMPEFNEVLQNSGTTKEEAISIFNGIDQDHSNNISYTEFLAASLSRRLWLTRERIRDAFQRLDVEGTGFITRENLKVLLGDDWTPDKVEQMMKEADSKEDGRIDFDEFLALMTKESSAAASDFMPIDNSDRYSTESRNSTTPAGGPLHHALHGGSNNSLASLAEADAPIDSAQVLVNPVPIQPPKAPTGRQTQAHRVPLEQQNARLLTQGASLRVSPVPRLVDYTAGTDTQACVPGAGIAMTPRSAKNGGRNSLTINTSSSGSSITGGMPPHPPTSGSTRSSFSGGVAVNTMTFRNTPVEPYLTSKLTSNSSSVGTSNGPNGIPVLRQAVPASAGGESR